MKHSKSCGGDRKRFAGADMPEEQKCGPSGAKLLRLAVLGAGAVGSNLAAHLCKLPGAVVSVIARGAHLAAMQARGLELRTAGSTLHCSPLAVGEAASLPPQDIVFVTLKAPSIPPMAPDIARLVAPGGVVVFFVNGVPWWMEEPDADAAFASLDRAAVLGGVVYSSNSFERPGRVIHDGGNQWLVGELADGLSERLERVAALMSGAGLNGVAHPQLRKEIWSKLLYNAPINPMAALTRLDCGQLSTEEALNRIGMQIRREIAATAAADGVDLAGHPALASWDDMKLETPVRPSMLQDVLAGRAMEVDAIVDAPRRIARRHRVPTPTLDVVSALIGGLATNLGQP